MNALMELLSSRVRAEVCRLLFGLRTEERHVRELARQSGCSFSAVQREMEKLAQLGLVVPRVSGNRTYFRSNEQHPFYPEMRSLVRKSSGLREALTEALADAPIQAAFIFGSEAAGTAKEGSDVDVLVIGTISMRDVVGKLHALEGELGREINPHVFSAEELAKRVRQKDHFVTTVLREPKVFLIGDADELARLAKKRVAAPVHAKQKRNGRPAVHR